MRLSDLIRGQRSKVVEKNPPKYSFELRGVSSLSALTGGTHLKSISLSMKAGSSICIGYTSEEEKQALVSVLLGAEEVDRGSLIHRGDNQSVTQMQLVTGLFKNKHENLQRSSLELQEFAEHNYPLWIVDDPCVSLDTESCRRFAVELTRHKPRSGMIVFSNSLSVARRCERVLVLHQGQLIRYPTSTTRLHYDPFSADDAVTTGLSNTEESENFDEQPQLVDWEDGYRPHSSLVLRKKYQSQGSLQSWLAWHCVRVEPVFISVAESEEDQAIVAAERRLDRVESLNASRLLESPSSWYNLWEYVSHNTLAQSKPLSGFDLCALAADLLSAVDAFEAADTSHGAISPEVICRRDGLWVIESHHHRINSQSKDDRQRVRAAVANEIARSLRTEKASGCEVAQLYTVLEQTTFANTNLKELSLQCHEMLRNWSKVAASPARNKLDLWAS